MLSCLAPGEVLMVRKEMWRLCGSVALDPKNSEWSCCRGLYPFHRPTQRCCQTPEEIFVIPKDCRKSEAEDCRTYTQRTPAQPSMEGPVCYWTGVCAINLAVS
ncbi:hypothetical protein QTO34_010255 [Cnephaeus nilssonii]|uniref:Uncharacterized protein n=1 Tax=Cnephaeus nilssonii TaxID=3371016 RepID=A0AA40HF00_CNENI|nr:hypothetical protein QTO34_010255 [Eptesicus nilssonii]